MINDHVVAFAEATGSWGGLGESGVGRVQEVVESRHDQSNSQPFIRVDVESDGDRMSRNNVDSA